VHRDQPLAVGPPAQARWPLTICSSVQPPIPVSLSGVREIKQPANRGGDTTAPSARLYSSNITPDQGDGIGGWTDEQIVTATRLGRRPNGERLIPVHPYTTFNGMAADDLKAARRILALRCRR